MKTKVSRAAAWAWTWNSTIGAGVVAIILLSNAVALAMRGEDPVQAVVFAAMGIGALGVLLGELGETPSDPVRRRLFKSVDLLILVSIVILGLSAALR
jgi:hypothetical protein